MTTSTLLFVSILLPSLSIVVSYFFFLMRRRPPRSTLFPCTTLFRSRGEFRFRKGVPHVRAGALPGARRVSRIAPPDTGRAARRVRWLTRGGLIAACAVGAGTTWGLGWRGLALLAAFLLSGSLLTQLAERPTPR